MSWPVQGDLPQDFFQLLVEVVKVEALIVLQDAMNPTARVPLSHAPPTFPADPHRVPADGAQATHAPSMDVKEDSDDEQGKLKQVPVVSHHLLLIQCI
jgi:hypothetical protein